MPDRTPDPVIASVPNFAEAREDATVQAIVGAMRLPGIRLLDLARDLVANRTVVTIAGSADAVAEATLRAAGEAVARIDLTRSGRSPHYPRIGAMDVLPFVPLDGASLAMCARLATETADALWDRFQLPSYLYAAAATRPDRVTLDAVRSGQFEVLREAVLRDVARRPDAGGPGLHPTAGACSVGARPVLIEFRVQFTAPDLRVARAVVRELSSQSAILGDPQVLVIGAAAQTQLAVVLTRWREAGTGPVQRAIEAATRKHGGQIAGLRLIGLLPQFAYEADPAWAAQLAGFDPEAHILERRLAQPLDWPHQ